MLRLKRNDNLEIVNIAEVIMSVRERVKKLDKFHLLTKNKKKNQKNLWYFRRKIFFVFAGFPQGHNDKTSAFRGNIERVGEVLNLA